MTAVEKKRISKNWNALICRNKWSSLIPKALILLLRRRLILSRDESVTIPFSRKCMGGTLKLYAPI